MIILLREESIKAGRGWTPCPDAKNVNEKRPMKHIKGIGNIATSLLLLAGLSACTAGDPLNQPKPATDEDVPVTLRAGSHTSRTKAVIDEGDSFAPLLVCSDSADYSTIRWEEKVDVDDKGVVTYQTANVPVYPHYGNLIHVTGLYPVPNDLTDGVATWALDGDKDLMYAAPLSGRRWDGLRICGNTDTKLDRSLVFEHQLTLLRFCAVRTASIDPSNEFRILSVTLKQVPKKATLTLKGATHDKVTFIFSEPGDLAASMLKDDAGNPKLVTSTDPDNPDAVGYVLLPVAEKYTADIETTFGTFEGREVTTVTTEDNPSFEKGYVNRITLSLGENGLSITAEDWTDVEEEEVKVN